LVSQNLKATTLTYLAIVTINRLATSRIVLPLGMQLQFFAVNLMCRHLFVLSFLWFVSHNSTKDCIFSRLDKLARNFLSFFYLAGALFTFTFGGVECKVRSGGFYAFGTQENCLTSCRTQNLLHNLHTCHCLPTK